MERETDRYRQRDRERIVRLEAAALGLCVGVGSPGETKRWFPCP